MTQPSERNMKEAEEIVLGVVNALGEVYPYSLKFKLDAEKVIATALQARDDEAAKLVEALKEISEGKGRFNKDPFEHAKNTIEDAILTAKEAIAAWEQGK